MNPRSILVGLVLSCALACGGGSGSYTVSGTVTTPTPQGGTTGVPGVLVVLQTQIPPTLTAAPVGITEQATTDAQGRYTIRTQPGNYTLKVVPSTQSTLVFSPSELDFILGAQNMDNQNFVGIDTTQAYLMGFVGGMASSGVSLDIQGPVSASVVTDARGSYLAGPMPAGAYTVTPHVAGATASPVTATANLAGHASAERDFLAMPAVSPVAITISGDAASGVGTTSAQPTLGSLNQAFGASPWPSLLVYYPTSNEWRFSWGYPLPSLASGESGELIYPGQPTAGTYGKSQELSGVTSTLGDCFQQPSTPGFYEGSTYSLTITSVGQGVPVQLPDGNELVGETWFPAHGTLHIGCVGASLGTPVPPGTVAVDFAF
jgi:hypothetical protein